MSKHAPLNLKLVEEYEAELLEKDINKVFAYKDGSISIHGLPTKKTKKPEPLELAEPLKGKVAKEAFKTAQDVLDYNSGIAQKFILGHNAIKMAVRRTLG